MNTNNHNPNSDPSLLARILKFFLWFLAAVCFSIIVEWVIATKWYPEQGSKRSLNYLKKELTYLQNSNLIKTNYGNKTVGYLIDKQDKTHVYVTHKLGVYNSASVLNSLNADHWFSRFGLLPAGDYFRIVGNIFNLITLRIVIVILCLPIFILMLVWGLSMGLTNRSIRQYQVRNESSWLYHWAKKMKSLAIILPILIYIAWPASIHPVIVFGPFAVAYGMSWLMFASKFKRLW